MWLALFQSVAVFLCLGLNHHHDISAVHAMLSSPPKTTRYLKSRHTFSTYKRYCGLSLSSSTSTTTTNQEKNKNNSDPHISFVERSRQENGNIIYNYDKWIEHRSADRFLESLSGAFTSVIIRQMLKKVLIVTFIASTIVAWNCLVVEGYTDLAGIHHDPLPEMASYATSSPIFLPALPFSITGSSLGLLLVFRTNSSYGRWSEAKKLWGSIVNNSRNLLRQASTWTLELDETERRTKLPILGRNIWAFSRSLQRHLSNPIEDELPYISSIKKRFDPNEAKYLIESNHHQQRHRPTKLLYDSSILINTMNFVDSKKNIQLDQKIGSLMDAYGACERIFHFPVPLLYTRHSARFLLTWLFFLPLAFWQPFSYTWNHIGMIPCSSFVSFFLFGIEELAVQLEEPFSILPLEGIVNEIDDCVNEFIDWNNMAQGENSVGDEEEEEEGVVGGGGGNDIEEELTA